MVSFIVITSGVVAIICGCWVIYTYSHKEEYTREKYAFRCLSASVSLITLLVLAVLPKEGLFDHVLTLIAFVTGNPKPAVDPAPASEKALIAVVVLIAIYWIFQSHKNWEGSSAIPSFFTRPRTFD
jgi:MFS superfamily sulfate permease-like transporter